MLSMTQWLNRKGHRWNIKRVRRLMDSMDLTEIYARPRTMLPDQQHLVYPYLLRGMKVRRVNQVWSADITCIPMEQGFMYLTAVIDWYSRYVLSWRLSNSLEGSFCIDALEDALTASGQICCHAESSSEAVGDRQSRAEKRPCRSHVVSGKCIAAIATLLKRICLWDASAGSVERIARMNGLAAGAGERSSVANVGN